MSQSPQRTKWSDAMVQTAQDQGQQVDPTKNKKAGHAGGSINNTSNLMKTRTNPIYNGGTVTQKSSPFTSSTGAIQPLTGASQYQYNPAMGNMVGYNSSSAKPVYAQNGPMGSRSNYTSGVGSRLGVRY